jgi:hypothetical protein
MIGKFVLVACPLIVLSASMASAGPCNTVGKDAGSGPTPGYIGQTVGAASSPDAPARPPTDAMNRAAGSTATSSQDTQAQQQGQPTAAQQALGAKPSAESSAKMADQGC